MTYLVLTSFSRTPGLYKNLVTPVKVFRKVFYSLNALYAEEVLRVTPAGIDTKSLFKQQNIESYGRANSNGTKTSLDFWFDSRQTTNDTSYEVGIFKITSETNGVSSTFYGQSHIVIKKIDGVWKITQDWDSPNINGRAITAEDFNRKPPLQF